MVKVKKGDSVPSELLHTWNENIGTGMPWDDGPDNIITHKVFKHSGVFLTNDEATDLLDCLKYGYEKHHRWHTKTIGKFIRMMGDASL